MVYYEANKMLYAVQDTIFEQSDSIWNGKNIYQFYVIKSYIPHTQRNQKIEH